MVAEKAGKSASVCNSAQLGNKGHRVICCGKQQGGMAYAVAVDEVGWSGVGALMQGIVEVCTVGAKQLSQGLVVAFGIGIYGGLLHQLTETAEELLTL